MKKTEDLDWEMPKEVDEEIKDLYTDSTTKKSKDR
jgi:RPA family protein